MSNSFTDNRHPSPETRLLLTMIKTNLSDEDVDQCWALVGTPEFDWGRFVDLAARHRVMPLLGRHVARYGFQRRRGDLEWPYPWLFVAAYHTNRDRNLALLDEWARLIRILNDSGLRYAIRKGPVLADRLHRDPGVRQMEDLDVLIHRSDVKLLREAFTAAGYVQGKASEDLQSIEPFARTTQAYWNIHLNNQLPYVKLGHRLHVPKFDIDVCLDIFQPNSGVSVPVSELLDRARPFLIGGEPAWKLGDADEFIDLCSHLHKEATSVFYIERGCDLELSKFLEVALASKLLDLPTQEEIIQRAKESGAEGIVYYSLHFASQLFPYHIPERMLDGLRPANLSYLDEYGQADGAPKSWHLPFPDRLFLTERAAEAGKSTIPST
ncbi:nucleotidyltransferase family protein [Nonomuraea sediminis]|uniref:nucleotidyltransferase family protein n=1 Tax=Nonomuraea sediminis TaxID=2835864 RepID=UPI001BDCC737|nr:nucleotidyltransferase family protein [Nonomuraea sediminis]